MPIGATVFLGVMLLVFAGLDIFMLVSLLRPGDERKQIIVWKASTFTLVGVTGAVVLDVIENTVRGQYEGINPLTRLQVTAMLYFATLLYYRWKHGG